MFKTSKEQGPVAPALPASAAVADALEPLEMPRPGSADPTEAVLAAVPNEGTLEPKSGLLRGLGDSLGALRRVCARTMLSAEGERHFNLSPEDASLYANLVLTAKDPLVKLGECVEAFSKGDVSVLVTVMQKAPDVKLMVHITNNGATEVVVGIPQPLGDKSERIFGYITHLERENVATDLLNNHKWAKLVMGDLARRIVSAVNDTLDAPNERLSASRLAGDRGALPPTLADGYRGGSTHTFVTELSLSPYRFKLTRIVQPVAALVRTLEEFAPAQAEKVQPYLHKLKRLEDDICAQQKNDAREGNHLVGIEPRGASLFVELNQVVKGLYEVCRQRLTEAESVCEVGALNNTLSMLVWYSKIGLI